MGQHCERALGYDTYDATFRLYGYKYLRSSQETDLHSISYTWPAKLQTMTKYEGSCDCGDVKVTAEISDPSGGIICHCGECKLRYVAVSRLIAYIRINF